MTVIAVSTRLAKRLARIQAFGALANKTYGAAPFTVSATASSALAVTFSSLTTAVCTVSGSTVTIKAGGLCTIQAAQVGNANYNAALNVSQSFTVASASQTITFATPSEQAVGVTSTLPATASSGLPVTFTSLTTPTCTVSGAVLTPLMLSMMLTSVGSGQVISRTGRYRWALIAGPVIMGLGGLISLSDRRLRLGVGRRREQAA